MKVSHFKGLTRVPSTSRPMVGTRESSASRAVRRHRKIAPRQSDQSEPLILRALVLSPTLRSHDGWTVVWRGPLTAACVTGPGTSKPTAWVRFGSTSDLAFWPPMSFNRNSTRDVCHCPFITYVLQHPAQAWKKPRGSRIWSAAIDRIRSKPAGQLRR